MTSRKEDRLAPFKDLGTMKTEPPSRRSTPDSEASTIILDPEEHGLRESGVLRAPAPSPAAEMLDGKSDALSHGISAADLHRTLCSRSLHLKLLTEYQGPEKRKDHIASDSTREMSRLTISERNAAKSMRDGSPEAMDLDEETGPTTKMTKMTKGQKDGEGKS